MNKLLLALIFTASLIWSQAPPTVRAAKCASSTGNDTYTCTTLPVTASWVTGDYFLLIPDTANTGACTLNAGPSAKNIKKMVAGVATDPSNNEIQAAMPTLLYYDGTNLVMITGVGGSGGGGGITSLGISGSGQTGATQVLAVGTTGSDFNITSSGDVQTFHLPDAGSSVRGAVTTGAQNFAGAKTFIGQLINSLTSTASTPAGFWSGSWVTGGSSTTNKPHFLIEPSGATSTNWSTSGTGLGINAATGFTGNLIDLQLNAAARFSITSAGAVTAANSFSVTSGASINNSSQVSGGGGSGLTARGALGSTTAGSNLTLSATNNFAPTSGSTAHNFVNVLATFNQTSTATNIITMLKFTPTSTSIYDLRLIDTGANSHTILATGVSQRAVYLQSQTYTKGSAVTVPVASTLEIEPPVAAGSVTITDAYSLNVTSGMSRFAGNIRLVPVAVGSLATCNAAASGTIAYVNDASGPTYNATIAGGGAVLTLVLCNGTNWTAH